MPACLSPWRCPRVSRPGDARVSLALAMTDASHTGDDWSRDDHPPSTDAWSRDDHPPSTDAWSRDDPPTDDTSPHLAEVVFKVLKNPNPLKDDEAFAVLAVAVLIASVTSVILVNSVNIRFVLLLRRAGSEKTGCSSGLE
ncbi:hypothetical protein VNO80_03110 [Phaseolus coccineus]|uniref:Uncharacterized protein n=1 Tax=Phaseolus coccineus TaxID=3886 RepID=A0AAN9NRF7_PHACN